MKVLHVLNSCDIGGVEWFVYYLSQTQKKRKNIEVGILSCKEEGSLKSTFQELNVSCYFIGFGPYDKSVSKYIRLNNIAKEYDVIHIHSFSPIISWYLYLKGHKIVYTNHSVYGFGRKKNKTTKIKRYLKKLFLNQRRNFLTYNSNYTKQFWEKKGVKNSNDKVIYNGVAFKQVNESKTKNDLQLPEKFLIGTTCRLIEWKRVDYLIKAFSNFQINKDDVHLVIIGDGSEKDKLANMTVSLGIQDKVSFVGNVINVEDFQNQLDICVFPSTTESFGLVAIECMNFGKPVLVMHDGGGITEIVSKIEPGNVLNTIEELTERIEFLYKTPNLLNGGYNEERVEFAKSFSMDRTEADFFSVYKRVL